MSVCPAGAVKKREKPLPRQNNVTNCKKQSTHMIHRERITVYVMCVSFYFSQINPLLPFEKKKRIYCVIS